MTATAEKYFPCAIRNTDDRRQDFPAYALLSMTQSFGLEEAVRQVRNDPPEHIFIIVGGQQAMNLFSNEKKDAEFGRDLTGADRIGGNQDGSGVWKGNFRIHTTSSRASVASTIFDKYGTRDLVIDIVNAKYEWAEMGCVNDKAYYNFLRDLDSLLDSMRQANAPLPKFVLIGFSRGGMFSLRLSRDLAPRGEVKLVVTIDPVQKYSKEGTEWDESWADWKPAYQRWEIKSGSKRTAGLPRFEFPILRKTAERHYNVFQRWGGRNDMPVDQPQGCAVLDASAPADSMTRAGAYKLPVQYKKLPSGNPYDQLDVVTEEHTEMPGKYRDWALGIVYDNIELPSSETTVSTPEDSSPGSTTEDSPPTTTPEDSSGIEQHRLRAYFHWRRRGCPIGSPETDWFAT
ncbi:MAG: DUF2934 domain-containing protein [Elusimicrobiota bacterium]|jgi:pimeloyl-ACP methyl ester carboxylesterase